jgi:hypothetical protein
MSKLLTLLLLAISFAPLPTLAKVYELNLAFCEIKTSCSVCIEDIKVSLLVNNENKTVTISGRATTGEQLEEKLSKCSVQSAADWQCDELRGLIKVAKGKLDYSPTNQQISVSGKQYETCLR